MLPPEIKRIRTALRQAERAATHDRSANEQATTDDPDLRSFLVREADNGRAVRDQIPLNDVPIELGYYSDQMNLDAGYDNISSAPGSSSSTESATEFSSNSEGECNAHINEPFQELSENEILAPALDSNQHQDQFLFRYRESARNRWYRKKSGQRAYWKANRQSIRHKYC
jgi:hypothetical protein